MTSPSMPEPVRSDGGWWVPDGAGGWAWRPDPPAAAPRASRWRSLPRGLRVFLGVWAGLTVLVGAGAVASAFDDKSASVAAEIPTEVPAAEATPETTPAPAPAPAPAEPIDRVRQAAAKLNHAQVSADGQDYTIGFRMPETILNEGTARAEVAGDLYGFLEALAGTDVAFARVVITCDGYLTNEFGEQNWKPQVRAVFDYDTVHRIQYDNVSRTDLSDVRFLTAEPMLVEQPLRDDAWLWGLGLEELLDGT